ncbi:hypothetical protein JCM8547_000899 [Rhodosporidiobolus lusitaniae]
MVTARGDVIASSLADGGARFPSSEEERQGRRRKVLSRTIRVTLDDKFTLYGEVLTFASVQLAQNGVLGSSPRLLAIVSVFPVDETLFNVIPTFSCFAPRRILVVGVQQIRMLMGVFYLTANEEGQCERAGVQTRASKKGTVWLGEMKWELEQRVMEEIQTGSVTEELSQRRCEHENQ